MKLLINDIYVRDNGERKNHKIKNHPYYLALKYKSKDIYEDYVSKNHVQRRKKSGKWEGFLEIYNSIKNNGFDKHASSIIIKNKEDKWVCEHGRHRMCMIRHLYPNKSIRVRHEKLKEICK